MIRPLHGVTIGLCYTVLMFQLLQPHEVPEAARKPAPRSLGELPIRDLLPGQALRIPLDGCSATAARKMHAALRVRAHRAAAATGRTYSTHKGDDAIYVTRIA